MLRLHYRWYLRIQLYVRRAESETKLDDFFAVCMFDIIIKGVRSSNALFPFFEMIVAEMPKTSSVFTNTTCNVTSKQRLRKY